MKDSLLTLAVLLLISIGSLTLYSIAPFVYPLHIVYIVIGLFLFYFFSKIDNDIVSSFSHLTYAFSIFLLILPLFIGEITRGAVRWIPLGPVALQPAELTRPFLFLFFARIASKKDIKFTNFIKISILIALPVILILLEPSLGVSILTSIGAASILLSSPNIKKKYIVPFIIAGVLIAPFSWHFLAPYQKTRVLVLLNPQSDKMGSGYNSLQSTISVGSGKLTGRGLGQGVQTQLNFLPEKHTDFIFAAISEEMGFVGATLVMLIMAFLLSRILAIIQTTKFNEAKLFCTATLVTMFAQTFVHIGMNMGMLPITGVPLPLVSSGGSSLIATLMGLGLVLGAKTKNR